MKIFTVSNQKGGVGKTVISYHLAKYLAGNGEDVIYYTYIENKEGKRQREFAFKQPLQNKRVLFIDLDPQGNSSSVLEPYQLPIFAHDFFTGEVALPDFEESLQVLPASEALKSLQNATSEEFEQNIGRFSANIQKNADKFDYCIIDTPPTENMTVRAALFVTDYVIAPIIPVQFSIDGIETMLKLVTVLMPKFNDKIQFLGMLPSKILGSAMNVNRSPDKVKQSRMHESVLRDIVTAYPHLMLLDSKDKLVAVSERQIIENAVTEKKAVWEMPGPEARTSTEEFFSVFSAINHRIGGF